jgi:hypothetical protein
VECLKKLPCVDEKYCPQVTFLGLWDEWMKKAGKYKDLYKMDTEIAINTRNCNELPESSQGAPR